MWLVLLFICAPNNHRWLMCDHLQRVFYSRRYGFNGIPPLLLWGTFRKHNIIDIKLISYDSKYTISGLKKTMLFVKLWRQNQNRVKYLRMLWHFITYIYIVKQCNGFCLVIVECDAFKIYSFTKERCFSGSDDYRILISNSFVWVLYVIV